MTARQLGFLVSKVLGIFFFVWFIGYISYYPTLLEAYRVGQGAPQGISGESGLPSWIRFSLVSLPLVVHALGAFIFWSKADWVARILSPESDKIRQPPAAQTNWYRLAFVLLGVYLLVTGVAASVEDVGRVASGEGNEFAKMFLDRTVWSVGADLLKASVGLFLMLGPGRLGKTIGGTAWPRTETEDKPEVPKL